LYIGLMSGTSLDGVDAVMAAFDGPKAVVLGHCSAPFPPALKAELLALNAPTDNELHRAALAANGLVRLYASQVAQLRYGRSVRMGKPCATVRKSSMAQATRCS
jgi:anhydro-N-acetylmuramic acid kinase